MTAYQMQERYRLYLPQDQVFDFVGICHAAFDDGCYERLKLQMKERPIESKEIVLSFGKAYSIYEDKDGKWLFVVTSETATGSPEGICQIEPEAQSEIIRFNREEDLLEFMRQKFDPDDSACPFRNLLGSWERHDLLQVWVEDWA